MRTKTGKISEHRTINKKRRLRYAKAAAKAPRPVKKRSTVLHKAEAQRRRHIFATAARFGIKVPGKEDDHEAVLEAIKEFCKQNKRFTSV